MIIKYILRIIIILLFVNSNVYSQDYDYSAVTNSYLNLREKPTTKSPIVAVIDLFEEVRSKISYDEFINKQIDANEVIAGRSGFWVKVMINGISGYCFSNYLIPGSKSNYIDDDIEYSILDSYYCFNTPRFNPKLDYYIVNKSLKEISFEKAKIEIRTNYHTKIFRDGTDYGRHPAIIVTSENEKNSSKIIGINKSLQLTSFSNINFEQIDLKDTSEVFILNYKNEKFSIKPNVNALGKFEIMYCYNIDDFMNEVDLNMFLYPNIEYDRIKNFASPELLLLNDFNYDGILDFVVRADNLPEGCGVEWKDYLLLSDGNKFKSVLVNTNGACN